MRKSKCENVKRLQETSLRGDETNVKRRYKKRNVEKQGRRTNDAKTEER